MLEIKNIKKEYKTGDLIQKALDGVSLNLRDNEFVAILGPSGSGKSTLLNIIGGLDKYDSGDLIIDGISTKKYKDRNWDSYRNHMIGFVFQSYNLISHQTLLANVELALTISGISKNERRQRALDALDKVGLKEQAHKKPNQLSGGQMQRVAIARALVNDPKILLADEPTGALDTDTSVQVMDLLKEVAKDRLVVMVTHNPELAYEYATRIVKLKDGKIIDDSNPYVIDKSEIKDIKLGKASMSFLTSLGLSFNNLLTKKARTLLVSFAGSIGIIGIALIMSLSNGVNAYIKNTEKETLSEYPLTLQRSTFDMSSLLSMSVSSNKNSDDNLVHENKVTNKLFSDVKSNDLYSFKQYIESDKRIYEYTNGIEYSYDISPYIYLLNNNQYYQVNPDTTLSSSGIAPTSSLYSSSFSLDEFSVLPENEELYINEYDIKAGHWPTNSHELVVVLNSDGTISDTLAYTLGLKNYQELIDMLANSKSNDNGEASYKYEDLLVDSYRLVNPSDLYTYDSENGIWIDNSDDTNYLNNLLSKSETLKVVGVVQAKEDVSGAMLSPLIYYHHDLIDEVIKKASESEIVKQQLANKDTNVFTNKPFGEEDEVSFDNLIKVNENAFNIDTSSLNLDLDMPNINLSEEDKNKLLSSLNSDSNKTIINNALQTLTNDYLNYLQSNENTDYRVLTNSLNEYMNSDRFNTLITNYLNSKINRDDISTKLNDLTSQIVENYSSWLVNNPDKTIQDYLNSDEVSKVIDSNVESIISSINLSDSDLNELTSLILSDYQSYIESNTNFSYEALNDSLDNYLNSDQGKKTLNSISNDLSNSDIASSLSDLVNDKMSLITASIQSSLIKTMSQLPSMISVGDDFIQITMDEDTIKNMFTSLMSNSSNSYESNLSKLCYVDENDIYSITIYPKDFEAKSEIKNIIEEYNNSVTEDKKIVYTDMAETLMSSVTSIVNTVSYVLIAFVAISLVVSSIMIGVITYISVLERRKEIGILRALGASKKNISNVFNAETLITGLLAGLIGIGISLLLLIPINSIIALVTSDSGVRAILPVKGAIFLVLLSMGLTLLGGLIPAKKASKQDPVTALRSE